MSNYTFNQLIDHVRNEIADVFDSVEFSTGLTNDQIIDLIHDALENHNASGYQVIYYSEGWEIINDRTTEEAAINGGMEDIIFEGGTSALDAVMLEAQYLTYYASQSIRSEIIDMIADEISAIIDTALNEGYEGKLHLRSDSAYGYFPHSRETQSGICIWDKNTIEGECQAVEGKIDSLGYLGACW